jgi:hypothetical protein
MTKKSRHSFMSLVKSASLSPLSANRKTKNNLAIFNAEVSRIEDEARSAFVQEVSALRSEDLPLSRQALEDLRETHAKDLWATKLHCFINFRGDDVCLHCIGLEVWDEVQKARDQVESWLNHVEASNGF